MSLSDLKGNAWLETTERAVWRIELCQQADILSCVFAGKTLQGTLSALNPSRLLVLLY